MKLTNEFKPIVEWANERGILSKGDPKTQALKTVEEVGELAKALIEGNNEELRDALGDVVVTLVLLAQLTNNSLEDCINEAYQVIAKRKGKMVDGTFIRDKDNA